MIKGPAGGCARAFHSSTLVAQETPTRGKVQSKIDLYWDNSHNFEQLWRSKSVFFVGAVVEKP